MSGRLQASLLIFAKVMNVWLKDCPPIIRLAYGAVLLEPVSDRRAGYKRSYRGNILRPIQIDDSSSDFFYQINRPRTLQDSNESVNRLSNGRFKLLSR